MSQEETRIFDATDKSMQDLVQTTEETLKDLDMTVKTLELDKTLMEVHGTGPVGNCVVTVYREGGKAYIRLKHTLMDSSEFWDSFSQFLSILAATPEELGERARVVQRIIDHVAALGAHLPEDEAWDFMYRFLRKYKRNPEPDEINQIAVSYVEMLEQDSDLVDRADQEISEEYPDVEFVTDEDEEEAEEYGGITPEDALRAMVREMETLTPSEVNYYLSLFPELNLDQKKLLVAKLRQVDREMDEIPYLTVEERESLRAQLMKLPAAKRQKKIASIIKKRNKRLEYYKMKEEEDQAKQRLSKIATITDLEKEIYLTSMLGMSLKEKVDFIERLEEVEALLDQVVDAGHELLEEERKRHREELLRVDDPAQRSKYVEDLKKEKAAKAVAEELFAAVPQLRFQDHEKVIKELQWLEPSERKARIEQIRRDFEEKTKKRDQMFAGSSAGNVCPGCGWIVGKWSKKCPRCGKDLTEW
ncbi:MAG: hypothetical protein Kow0069_29780 [Promethearchaeota archaeon]